ncbi:MAG: hypothetical protein K0R57_4121 [Paenibacillaceae bacterium]|jgi:hypothetical protein|nr:hypothetical protein [Paenibacillaceae bacterium]
MKTLKNITLEMSLKPFKSMEPAFIEQVCREMFAQWQSLLKHADLVSVMLWTSDGSEILEYKGDADEEVEWAKYIGGANPRSEWNRKNDPEAKGLHTRYYLYMDHPPVLTYRILREIVDTIKRIGTELTGKPVRVGATFDPGPEFAKSDFKYVRHEEICMGNTMGKKSFVCCYSVLHQDSCRYAGFPEGIPEGTPFGTFFGRQSRLFLEDLGFDYLWLSNGFGFGTETWGTTGALFDGEAFDDSRFNEVRGHILHFWRLFREECPEIRVETRGTNLTAGIDLSTDGVPLKDIYEGGFNLLPPPNSPWAALDGDFGLELAGYMSRVAELPGDSDEDYLFRFYVHDPWWMNSPWLDRYEGQPHDIYLPLAIARINHKGDIQGPNHLNFLTVDNSLGEMPDQCPNELIPHLIKAYEHGPDAAAPLVWVYPFREYQEPDATGSLRIEKPFFEDWFIRGAINNGLPLSTVVSSAVFAETADSKPELYKGSVIVSPVPVAGSKWEESIVDWISRGEQVILYGSVSDAGRPILEALNLATTSALEGELELALELPADELRGGQWPAAIMHRANLSDGGIDTCLRDDRDPATTVLAYVSQGGERRVAALWRNHPAGGAAAWLRGTNASYYRKGSHLLVPDDASKYFPAEGLLRLLWNRFGTEIRFVKNGPSAKNPVVMLHKHQGAFFFSGYMPDTTVALKLKFPLGAPLLMGSETRLEQGYSCYHMPRAWHSECRVFVQQEDETATLVCKEVAPVSYEMRRRIRVTGLNNATLTILPQQGKEQETQVLLNSDHPHMVSQPFQWQWKQTPWGTAIEAVGITGTILISNP